MRDIFHRKIEYLRISITDRCNFRCIYCMPEEGVEFIEHDEILTFDEIVRICRLAVDLGITKIKITGGEPLVRRDCVDLIRKIKAIPGIEEVTMTTNGLLLGRHLEELAEIGIDGINISLDAVERERFRAITRSDQAEAVLDAIRKSVASGIKTKVNALIMPGINEDQILPLAELTRDIGVHVRYIEVMPIGIGKDRQSISPEEIRRVIEAAHGPLKPWDERLGNGPAKYFSIAGYTGKIGFISAVSDCFCDSCNRVRLTSTGFLKACLQYSYGIELKPLLREGYSDEDIRNVMSQIIYTKPKEHQFTKKAVMTKDTMPALDCGFNPRLAKEILRWVHQDDAEDRNMSAIGG